MFKHLLVPLDGSTFAESALEYALSLADQYGSDLTLLQVLPPGQYHWEAEMRAELPHLQEEIQTAETGDAAHYLHQKEDDLRARGYTVTALVIRGQGVPDAILDAAEEEQIDTIVMSTHGLTGVRRWLLGSVASRVVRHATVPVLLVRNNRD